MKQAQKALERFKDDNSIPNMGQNIVPGFGPGTAHIFSDGSIAMQWEDGELTVGELKAPSYLLKNKQKE